MSVFVSQKLNDFFSKFKKYHYKKGETILRGGDVPQGVCFINKGYVRDYYVSKEGEELIFIIFKSEDFFPIRWAFNGTITNHYFEAMTVVDLWRCPKEEFIAFIEENPEIFFELTRRITLRLGGIMKRMAYLVFSNAYEKVASILMICAERFGEKKGKSIVIPIPLTHKDLAMLVGMARETISIEMKKLEKKGIIKYKKRLIVIKNINKLAVVSLVDKQN